MGKNAIKEGELEKGLEIYQSVLELDPDSQGRKKKGFANLADIPIKLPKLNRKLMALSEKALSDWKRPGRSLAALNGIEELLQQYPRDPSLLSGWEFTTRG